MLLLLAAVGVVFAISQRGKSSTARAGRGYEFVADIDNWRRTDRERAVSSPYDFSLAGNLSRVPLSLGGWAGTDVPQTNLEVAILLEPEQYVYRLYTRADGRSLWLSLIGSRKTKSFHSPQICYDTSGWQTDVSSEAVMLAEGEVYTLRLLARKALSDGSTVQHLVLYFFLWPSSARDLQEGTVLVKVTVPVSGNPEGALALAEEFMRLLFTSARA